MTPEAKAFLDLLDSICELAGSLDGAFETAMESAAKSKIVVREEANELFRLNCEVISLRDRMSDLRRGILKRHPTGDTDDSH